MNYRKNLIILFLYFGLGIPGLAKAKKPIVVAAASNFAGPLEEIAELYTKKWDRQVKIVLGSTGKLYAQIAHGAPYDVYLAADARRPFNLQRKLKLRKNRLFPYAIGKIALWSPDPHLVDANGLVLRSDNFVRLAIANPDIAPYGKAAFEALSSLNLWEQLSGRLVRGENISQTFQFVEGGHAQLAFVALSQLISTRFKNQGTVWIVPQKLYSPIEQYGLRISKRRSAMRFIQMLVSPEAKRIMAKHGYDNP